MHAVVTPRIALVCVDPGVAKNTGYREKFLVCAEELARRGSVDVFGYDLLPSAVANCRMTWDFAELGARSQMRRYWIVCRELARNRYNLVFTQTSFEPLWFLMLLVARLSGAKTAYRYADSISDVVRGMRKQCIRRTRSRFLASVVSALAPVAEHCALHLSTYILATSNSLARGAKRVTKGRTSVYTVYNYVQTIPAASGEVGALTADLRGGCDLLVAYFGHIQPEIRGLELVLDAFAQLPREFRFVMLGENQWPEYFERIIRQLDLENRTRVLSAMPKPLALAVLREVDYAILGRYPPWALPAKLFDAIAVGVPLILPSQMRDAVELFGHCSVTYDQRKVSSLVSVLSGASAERNRLAQAARQAASQQPFETFERGLSRVLDEIRVLPRNRPDGCKHDQRRPV